MDPSLLWLALAGPAALAVIGLWPAAAADAAPRAMVRAARAASGFTLAIAVAMAGGGWRRPVRWRPRCCRASACGSMR